MKALDQKAPDLVTELKRKLEHQMIINDFVKEVLRKETVDDILWSICKNVIAKLEWEDCVIYMIDEKRQLLIQKAAHGPKNPVAQEIIDKISIPLGQGVVGSVANSGIAEVVNDTRKDSRYIIDDEFRLSEITVPIIYNGKIIGVIDSEHSQKDFFTDFHLQLLLTISSLCANRIGYAMAHEELSRHKDQLEIIVEERTSELNASINKLSISNANLERYARVVSHDLNAPLNTIIGFIKLIEKNETNLTSESTEYLNFINEAVGRMSGLLKELLKTSVETEEAPDEVPIDFDSILSKVIGNLQFEIDEKNVTIDCKESLPNYRGLETHFIQLFQNLISNSIKYKIPDQSQKIEISSKSGKNAFKLEFKDYGIGLEREFLQSIFKLGNRANKNESGKGIGLHTCKQIVEQYNGSISAYSEGLNKGLTITIRLPQLH